VAAAVVVVGVVVAAAAVAAAAVVVAAAEGGERAARGSDVVAEGRAMTKGQSKAGVRITNQFRKRAAMVYDLSCDEVRLTLEVTQRPNHDGLGEWLIEAGARQDVEKPTINAPGATRTDALAAVARSWTAKQGAYGFPAVDWEAVSAAMQGVRAL
jgi:hypothetical protein